MSRPHGKPSVLEERRARAIELYRQEIHKADICKELGISIRSLDRWISIYEHEGEGQLKARFIHGRPKKLYSTQLTRLKTLLEDGPQGSEYATAQWTSASVAELIRSKFGINYNTRYLPRLLRSLGWELEIKDAKPTRIWVRKR